MYTSIYCWSKGGTQSFSSSHINSDDKAYVTMIDPNMLKVTLASEFPVVRTGNSDVKFVPRLLRTVIQQYELYLHNQNKALQVYTPYEYQ